MIYNIIGYWRAFVIHRKSLHQTTNLSTIYGSYRYSYHNLLHITHETTKTFDNHTILNSLRTHEQRVINTVSPQHISLTKQFTDYTYVDVSIEDTSIIFQV